MRWDIGMRMLTVAVAATLLLPTLAARAYDSRTVTLTPESTNNAVIGGWLGAACPGDATHEAMPDVWQSVCVYTGLAPDQPISGAYVVFQVLDRLMQPAPGLLRLGQSSANTDSDGRFLLPVNGPGYAVADGTRAYVKATWWITQNPPLYRTTLCAFRINRPLLTYATTGLWHGPLTVPIKYTFRSPMSKMQSYADNSTAAWTFAGDTSFVYDGSGSAQIICHEDQFGPESTFVATTEAPGGDHPNAYLIQYNMTILDADYDPNNKKYPMLPLFWRTGTWYVANHEMGHAVLLYDNSTYRKSVMEPTAACWYDWHVDLPNAGADVAPVRNAY